MIITIDGPSACGKSTLAKMLAAKLNYDILHTGLIYRAMAKKTTINKDNIIDSSKKVRFIDLADKDLHSEEFGMIASKIAAIPEIREISNQLQKEFAKECKNIVVEGRDSGTVVFPEAEYKFFIHVDIEIRAMRRFKELQGKNNPVIYESVLEDMKQRDFQDINREIAPLKPAINAIILDNSTKSLNDILSEAMSFLVLK